eukprot:TRINITY_DN32993_c0_g1_i1.p1 TRINITY_DN32993_c0_g1~~TRINITY_DN32993_c0_g1_i1.p1  ORF type:complete len:384 (+),score=102.97 TRINITY_DN32993_c0_g1_i1:79-1152(+)
MAQAERTTARRESDSQSAQDRPPATTPVSVSIEDLESRRPAAPRLPQQYWQKGTCKHWDEMWVPVEHEELRRMPVQPNCSRILPYLSIGNVMFASDLDALRKHGVTHVLSVTKRKPPADVTDALHCRQVIVNDTPVSPISTVFEAAAEHIIAARDSGGHCLVHCRAGVSRGSCVVIAYMIRHMRKTLKDAYAQVKAARAIAHPNKGFLEQLQKLEVTVHGARVSVLSFEMLPHTLWERAEHIGLNDPIPSVALCKECERRAAAEYARRYGHSNQYLTQDAGLGGKMELHVVELYNVCDFAWLDQVLVDVLYTNRPADGNYIPRRLSRNTHVPPTATDSPALPPAAPPSSEARPSVER